MIGILKKRNNELLILLLPFASMYRKKSWKKICFIEKKIFSIKMMHKSVLSMALSNVDELIGLFPLFTWKQSDSSTNIP